MVSVHEVSITTLSIVKATYRQLRYITDFYLTALLTKYYSDPLWLTKKYTAYIQQRIYIRRLHGRCSRRLVSVSFSLFTKQANLMLNAITVNYLPASHM